MTRPTSRNSSLVALATSLVIALLTLAGLSACSGGAGGGDKTPKEVLAQAKKTLDETDGVELSLTTTDLPTGINGILSATGIVTKAPAFDGKIKVMLSGTEFEVPVISVDDQVHAQIPLSPGWSVIDPGQYGAPDPAALITGDNGFSSLLATTADAKAGESVRGGANNDEVLTTYTGTVAGEAMSAVIPSASGDSFDATYLITDQGELREASFTGEFYPDTDAMTYQVTFEKYGSTKEIAAPPAN